MSLSLPSNKDGGKKLDIERVPDGTYIGIIQGVIDLGRQYVRDFKTGEIEEWDDGNKKIRKEVWISFELPTEQVVIDDGSGGDISVNRVIGKKYTNVAGYSLSAVLSVAAAQKTIEKISDLIGVNVMVTIGSTSGGKAKITNVSPLMKGMPIATGELEPQVLDLDELDTDVLEKLPAFIQNMVKESLDYTDNNNF